MNNQTQPTILPRQQWIRNACLNIETQFNGRITSEAFIGRLLVAVVLLLLLHRELQSFQGLPGYISLIPVIGGLYYGMLLVAHRFHDIGDGISAANMLNIIIPIAIWFWIGDKLPDAFYNITTGLLFAWPLIVLLRLCFTPSGPDNRFGPAPK